MKNTKFPISVIIITHNEEDNIIRCLESVCWADEIVVVDSFSTDNTVQLCRQITQHVIQKEWMGYKEQKSYALQCATHDWILSIDADEVVSPELAAEIQKLREDGLRYDAYKMPRLVFYLGKWVRHGGWYPDYKLRFFNRKQGKWTGIDLHEEWKTEGRCGKLRGNLYHYTYKDINSHINQINNFTSLSAKQLFNEKKKSYLHNIIINPLLRFIKAYFIKRGFLDGKVGFFIALLASYYVFLKYIKLWELYHSKQ